MRKLLGPHVGGRWTDKLELLRVWQPPFVLVLQPEVEKVTQLRAACPRAIITGRFYHDDNYYASNIAARPQEFAREIHNEIISNPVTPLLDYVQSNNETNQDWQGIQKLNEFSLAWMALADQSQAYKCAILAFSVGNPDMPHKPGDPAGFDGRMLYWQQVLLSLNYAQRNDHILLLHAYGYPNLFAPDADWYIYRYERQVQANLRALGITDLKYAYGEIGIDRLIVNGKGGYKVATTDQDYTNQLLQWERDQQGQNLLLGGAIFTFGDSGGWDTYDIASGGVASMLATHYANHANEYTSSPTGGQSDMTKTFLPSAGTGTVTAPALPPREWDARLTARGVTVETPPLAPGQHFWRVVKARWFSEAEAGGRRHIYVGAPAGTPFRVDWPSGNAHGAANGRGGFDAGNYPMSASLNEFSVRVDDGKPSESVRGIGMGADGNPKVHTATEVVFALATMPAITQLPYIPNAKPDAMLEVGPSVQNAIIDPRVAQAILQVESGGRTHGEDGKPIIRFEAHIFKTYLGNDDLWARHFRTDATRPWVDQMWRKSEGDPWRTLHTGKQADEWDAFRFAANLAPGDAAYKSISMGAAQILGINHAKIGYPSAQAMYAAFEDAQMQTIGFVNFCLATPGLLEAMRTKNWEKIAELYNGSGNVKVYAPLLRQAYESLRG